MSVTDFEATISALGQTMVVAHVAANPLLTAHAAEDVASVAAWAGPAGINNVPVVRDGGVVGVLENLNGDYADMPDAPRDGRAERAMRSLHAGMLLEGRAPLSGLVDLLLEAPHYRLVLDAGRIESIVTPSDMVKLPMRVLLFAMVAHLEQAMIGALRRLFATDEDALEALDADSQQQILELYDKLEQAALNPSLMEVASLRQKARALTAAGVFGDREEAEAEFDDLVTALRNPLMHAAGYVDDSLETLRGLARRLSAVAARTQQAHRARR